MKRFFWDFRGPRAEQIARHHAQHVTEFVTREKLQGCEVAVEKVSDVLWTASVSASDDAAPLIQRALRPPRAE